MSEKNDKELYLNFDEYIRQDDEGTDISDALQTLSQSQPMAVEDECCTFLSSASL